MFRNKERILKKTYRTYKKQKYQDLSDDSDGFELIVDANTDGNTDDLELNEHLESNEI
jgi:hypothetical protein